MSLSVALITHFMAQFVDCNCRYSYNLHPWAGLCAHAHACPDIHHAHTHPHILAKTTENKSDLNLKERPGCLICFSSSSASLGPSSGNVCATLWMWGFLNPGTMLFVVLQVSFPCKPCSSATLFRGESLLLANVGMSGSTRRVN